MSEVMMSDRLTNFHDLPIGTNAQGGLRTLVTFDPLSGPYNRLPPGILITGSPGSGKTYFTLGTLALTTLLKYSVVAFDFKNDLNNLAYLESEIGKIQTWDLGERGQEGILDPFIVGHTIEEKKTLVIGVIETIVGRLKNEELQVVLSVIEDLISGQNTQFKQTLDGFIRFLTRAYISSESPVEFDICKNIAAGLAPIRDINFGSLLFAKDEKHFEPPSFTHKTTVVTLEKLGFLNEQGQVDRGDSIESRVRSAIMYVLTSMVSTKLLAQDNKLGPKLMVIDEAWTITGTNVGIALIMQILRLGSAKGTGLILASQNQSDLDSDNMFSNMINTRFAFKCGSVHQAKDVLKEMWLDDDEGNIETLLSLKKGQCLMKGLNQKSAVVAVNFFQPTWPAAFDTNPSRDKEAMLRSAGLL